MKLEEEVIKEAKRFFWIEKWLFSSLLISCILIVLWLGVAKKDPLVLLTFMIGVSAMLQVITMQRNRRESRARDMVELSRVVIEVYKFMKKPQLVEGYLRSLFMHNLFLCFHFPDIVDNLMKELKKADFED
ncbi:hypothetical protein ES702_02690 [subsurface metagenome]